MLIIYPRNGWGEPDIVGYIIGIGPISGSQEINLFVQAAYNLVGSGAGLCAGGSVEGAPSLQKPSIMSKNTKK